MNTRIDSKIASCINHLLEAANFDDFLLYSNYIHTCMIASLSLFSKMILSMHIAHARDHRICIVKFKFRLNIRIHSIGWRTIRKSHHNIPVHISSAANVIREHNHIHLSSFIFQFFLHFLFFFSISFHTGECGTYFHFIDFRAKTGDSL